MARLPACTVLDFISPSRPLEYRASAVLFFVPLLRLIGKTSRYPPPPPLLCVSNNILVDTLLSSLHHVTRRNAFVIIIVVVVVVIIAIIRIIYTIQFLATTMEVGRRPVGSFMVRGSWKVRFTRLVSFCKWERFEWEVFGWWNFGNWKLRCIFVHLGEISRYNERVPRVKMYMKYLITHEFLNKYKNMK